MAAISYENIDLFFYHSIDIDFARFCSILNYGILSKKAAMEENVKYYYRNYTHSSCRNEYISVNHFPQTVLRYFQIENELYDFNTNKICFVLDGIEPLTKQACKNRYCYTNERHVYYKIEPSMIKGILLREVDAKKKVADISFNYKYTAKDYLEDKIFITLNFFRDNFLDFLNTDKLYYLIGKLREAQVCGLSDVVVIELIGREIKKNINRVLSKELGLDNPTLLDAITYFNNGKYPIYVMNRFDIQLSGLELARTDKRLEKFREMTNKTVGEMRKQKEIDKKILRLLKKMTDAGVDIYYGYSEGPLIEKDLEIVEEIKRLSLKK